MKGDLVYFDLFLNKALSLKISFKELSIPLYILEEEYHGLFHIRSLFDLTVDFYLPKSWVKKTTTFTSLSEIMFFFKEYPKVIEWFKEKINLVKLLTSSYKSARSFSRKILDDELSLKNSKGTI